MESPVLLLFADVSGYTRFVTSHRKTWAHGQYVISELMKSILSQVRPPFQVAKLEGDALFLYAVIDSKLPAAEVGQMVLSFFDEFSQKLRELHESNLCHCECCDHIGDLRLKVILHSGSALIYEIAGFKELSGTDVIALHRLSKNSLKRKEYLLLTDPAYKTIPFPETITFSRHLEKYDHIGEIATFVHLPNLLEGKQPSQNGKSLILRLLSMIPKMLYAWSVRLGLRKLWLNQEPRASLLQNRDRA